MEPFSTEDTELILRPGTCLFGRYALKRILGEGGMGVVWHARDEKLEREVALKVLPDRARRDPEAVRDLKRETRRCLELTHPHIVRVYDFVEDRFSAVIAMEYVPGKSLSAWKAARAEGCFDPADLMPLVRQLCSALDYAHTQAQVVHRDLKPANLLLTAEGMLKVADFGIARSLRETHTRHIHDERGVTGSLGFMGPQQLESKSKPEPADDIYALGATLYDLLTGKPPFFGPDIFNEIRNSAPLPLAERRAALQNHGASIPPEWQRTIFACMAKRAEDRPNSVLEVLARLEAQEPDPDQTLLIVEPLEKNTGSRAVLADNGEQASTPGTTRSGSIGLRRRQFVLVVSLVSAAVALVAIFGQKHGATDPALMTIQPPASSAPTTATNSDKKNPSTPETSAKSDPISTVVGAPGVEALQRVSEAGFTGTSEPSSRFSGESQLPSTENQKSRTQTLASPTAVVPTQELKIAVIPLNVEAHLWLGPQSDLLVPADGKLVVKDLPDGEYDLAVRASGFHPFYTRVKIDGSREGMEIALAALKSSVQVTARVGTMITAVDSRGHEIPVGRVPASGVLLAKDLLNLGTYTFKLDHPDYASDDMRSVGTLTDRAVELSPVQRPFPGELRILTMPSGAQVAVNGQSVGITPATVPRQASETPLTVEVSVRGYRSVQQTVTLRPKEVRMLDFGTLVAEIGAIEFGDRENKGVEAKKNDENPRIGSLVLKDGKQKSGGLTAFPKLSLPWENTLGMKFVSVSGTDVLFSVWDTRVKDYSLFVTETRREWVKPKFEVGPTHPVNVSWDDAQAFCRWLTEKERLAGKLGRDQCYRLPFDWEWSVAVGLTEPRVGTPDSKSGGFANEYPWGKKWPPPHGAGNYADESFRRTFGGNDYVEGYNDGYPYTSPVGNFPANKFGLHDMGGNLWQWCEDWINDRGIYRVLRGGSFTNTDTQNLLRSSQRLQAEPATRFLNNHPLAFFGFRCVIATKEQDSSWVQER